MSSDDDTAAAKRDPRATTFLVVRHAESAANAGGYFASQSDSPLSPLGEAQAAALGRALARSPIDAAYTSDLTRARRTASAIASAHGLELVATPLLRERSMGELTGMTFPAAQEKYPDVWRRLVARDPDLVPPGGESHRQLAARVARFLGDVTVQNRGGTVLVASHGGTIHHLVRQLLGVTDLAIPFALHVDNASVSRVDLLEHAAAGGNVAVPRLVYVNRVVFARGEIIER